MTPPTQIDLSWTDNTGGAAVYQIERSPNGYLDWTALNPTLPGATSYSDTAVPCGSLYYRVRAFDSAGSVYSPYSFNVEAKACDPLPIEWVQNGGFEATNDWDNLPAMWIPKKLDNDKRVVNKPSKNKIVAHEGEAAFQFKASPGVKSSLEQIIDLSEVEGETMTLSAWAEGKALSGAKVQIKIVYDNGTIEKFSFDSTELNAGTYAYKQVSVTIPVNEAEDAAKLRISLNNGTGRLRIDAVSLQAASDVQTLPLPAAP